MFIKTTIKGVFSCFIVLICLLILTEAFLHLVPPFDRFITYYDAKVMHRNNGPNKEYIYKGNSVGSISEFKVKTNRLGFHDRDYDFDKGEGCFRILVLGDSQVEAVQVPLKKTFHKILEERLQDNGKYVEVIALGKSGYGPREASELYSKIGKLYEPDLVIWSFTDVNDIKDSCPELKTLIRKRNTHYLRKVPEFLEFSKLASFFYTRRWKITKDMQERPEPVNIPRDVSSKINEVKDWDYIVYLKKWPPIYEKAWNLFKEHYCDLTEKIKSDRREMIVISAAGVYPDWIRNKHKDLEWDFQKPDQLVAKLSKKNEVCFISMKALFREYRKVKGKRVIYRNDGHLNQQGHRMVADVLYLEVSRIIGTETISREIYISWEYHFNEYGHSFAAKELVQFFKQNRG